MVQEPCFFGDHTEEKITPTKPFFMFLQFQKMFPYNVMGPQRTLSNEYDYFQDRLHYLKIQELLLGDLFEVGKYLSNEIAQNATER